MGLFQSLQHSGNSDLRYINAVLGAQEVDNFVLITGGILVDKLQDTFLSLEGHLSRSPLHTRMRRRHCTKAHKVHIQQADPLLRNLELASYLSTCDACAQADLHRVADRFAIFYWYRAGEV